MKFEYLKQRTDSRFRNDHQGFDSFTINEMVHDIRAHVWGRQIEVTKFMIVAHGLCPLHRECMLYSRIRFLSGC